MKKNILKIATITPLFLAPSFFLISCGDENLIQQLKKQDESYLAVIYNKDAKNLEKFEEIIVNSDHNWHKKLQEELNERVNLFNDWKIKNSYFKNLLKENNFDFNFDGADNNKLREKLSGLEKEIKEINVKSYSVSGDIKESKLYKQLGKYLQDEFNKNFVEFQKSTNNSDNNQNILGHTDKNRKEKIQEWIDAKLKDNGDFFFIYVRNGQIIKFEAGFSAEKTDDINKWIDDAADTFYSKQNSNPKELFSWDSIYTQLTEKFK